MNVQAEVSLYPLRTRHIGPTLDGFLNRLGAHAISVEPGPMSSHIKGAATDVFAALRDGFAAVAQEQEVALIVKISNACPVESRTP
ncbi:MAG TPA: YkoF family thiamine/hydroxymethylpyrimidine-binding protein [Candidatus Hydrogenedentes bacterium]|nr:YkoF family thiamine/hydroxymethylpyrimidine-binding protein [Candidatus Hydrogenedentota bacterium]HPG68854.1 YkoF family thiamine/hydroxymethylpyrimidine-binding protein [Candidatus Hydrogenedentota bacterium]